MQDRLFPYNKRNSRSPPTKDASFFRTNFFTFRVSCNTFVLYFKKSVGQGYIYPPSTSPLAPLHECSRAIRAFVFSINNAYSRTERTVPPVGILWRQAPIVVLFQPLTTFVGSLLPLRTLSPTEIYRRISWVRLSGQRTVSLQRRE